MSGSRPFVHPCYLSGSTLTWHMPMQGHEGKGHECDVCKEDGAMIGCFRKEVRDRRGGVRGGGLCVLVLILSGGRTPQKPAPRPRSVYLAA